MWAVGCGAGLAGLFSQNFGIMFAAIVLILLSFVAMWLSFGKDEE